MNSADGKNAVVAKHLENLANAAKNYTLAALASVSGGGSSGATSGNVLSTVASTVDGSLWYEMLDGVPILKLRHGNYEYNFNYDTITYRGGNSNLVAHLPFDSSATADACGNEWVVFGSGTVSVGSTDAIKGNALQVSGNSYIRTVDKITYGGADFTIRWHYRMDSTQQTYANVFSSKVNIGNDAVSYLAVYSPDRSKLNFCYGNSAGAFVVDDTIAKNLVGAIHHIEIDYFHAISTLKIFVDGQLAQTFNLSVDRTARYVALGSSLYNTTSYMIGTIDEFQLFDGVALHSSNFTPPTAADYS